MPNYKVSARQGIMRYKQEFTICGSRQASTDDDWAIAIGPELVISLLKRGSLIHFATIQISLSKHWRYIRQYVNFLKVHKNEKFVIKYLVLFVRQF